MQKSVIGSICAYLMSCDDGFWKHPRSCPNECVYPIWNKKNYNFFIHCVNTGLDIKHLVYMPIGHVVLKIYVPCKIFCLPSQYLFKPCKAYVHGWENKYMPRLKNHLPSRARNHESLCALRQDLHAPGMQACLNVEPWNSASSINVARKLVK